MKYVVFCFGVWKTTAPVLRRDPDTGASMRRPPGPSSATCGGAPMPTAETTGERQSRADLDEVGAGGGGTGAAHRRSRRLIVADRAAAPHDVDVGEDRWRPEQRGAPLVSGADVSPKQVHAGRQADAGDDDLAAIAAQVAQAHPDLAVDAELLGRQYPSVDPAVDLIGSCSKSRCPPKLT